MSIFTKKKFLIPLAVMMLLVGAFWPHISSYWRYKVTQSEMKEVALQVEAEFPEINDLQAFHDRTTPDSNGWPTVQQAITLLEEIEKREAKFEDESEDLPEDYIEFDSMMLDLYDWKENENTEALTRYIDKTEPVMELLRKAAKYDAIVPRFVTEGGSSLEYIQVIDTLTIFNLAFDRAEMHRLCGRYQLVEDEYYFALKLSDLFHCDTSVIGAMVHHGVKERILSRYELPDNAASIRILIDALEYANNGILDPAEVLRNELVKMHYMLDGYMDMSFSDVLDMQGSGSFWRYKGGNWGHRWTDVADNTEYGLDVYKSVLEAAISLRDEPIDYHNLVAVVDIFEEVNRQPRDSYSDLTGYGTAEIVVKPALLFPLQRSINTVHANLRLLESGPLGENRAAVDALVKSSLQGYIVDWSEPTDIDMSDRWNDEMLFVVRPETHIWKRYEDYAEPPILVYEPLKTD